MDLWTDESTNKNFKNTLKPNNATSIITIDAARNEYESAQILLRGDKDFHIYSLDFTNLEGESDSILNSCIKYNFQDYITFNDDISYPDPLLNTTSVAVKAKETQGIWITVYIPKETVAGKYTGKAVIHTSEGDFEAELKVEVFQVLLPDTSEGKFDLEYWSFFTGAWYHGYSEDNFIKNYYGFEKYSEKWWQLVDKAAENMKEHRINVLLVRTQDLLLDAGTTIDNNGLYYFNWSLFDKYIQLFIDKGVVKKLSGFQLLEQFSVDNVHAINRDNNGNMTIINEPFGSEAAENWLDQYLPALRYHLEEKGWLNIWLQHIADEPNHNPENWISAREKVRKHIPEIKCSEPLDVTKFNDKLKGHMDLWIPRIEQFDEELSFFTERKAAGDEVWVYSCCEPSSEYFLNKFIDRPYWHSRLLSWGCFKYGLNGFLHWGYNYWNGGNANFGLNPDAIFKGDGFIVYPDLDNKTIKNSVRLIATRDGIEEFELFKILESKNPDFASKIVNSVFTNFSYFSANTTRMKDMRRQLLIAASA